MITQHSLQLLPRSPGSVLFHRPPGAIIANKLMRKVMREQRRGSGRGGISSGAGFAARAGEAFVKVMSIDEHSPEHSEWGQIHRSRAREAGGCCARRWVWGETGRGPGGGRTVGINDGYRESATVTFSRLLNVSPQSVYHLD